MPIAIAYIPLGLIFGLLLENEGYSWYLAPIMSISVFGASVQFLAISLLSENFSLLSILFACFFLAIRNSFYVPGFFTRHKNFSLASKCYLCFALVDSTNALLHLDSPVDKSDDERYCLYVSAIVHSCWAIVSLFGVFVGRLVPPIPGFRFVLTILFTILTIDKYLKIKQLWPFVFAFVVWVTLQNIIPKFALVGSIGLCALVIFAKEKISASKIIFRSDTWKTKIFGY